MKKERANINNLCVCYCLLKNSASREGNKRLQLVTEKLNEAQDYYEGLGARAYYQAFVYGNREAAARPFAAYEMGFRAALDEAVTQYSICDALLLSYENLQEMMAEIEGNDTQEGIEDMYRLVIISDYALDNDSEAVAMMVRRINDLRKNYNLQVCYCDVYAAPQAGNIRQIIDYMGTWG